MIEVDFFYVMPILFLILLKTIGRYLIKELYKCFFFMTIAFGKQNFIPKNEFTHEEIAKW